MKFSTQEDYGLRVLLFIAAKGPGGSSTIPEIAAAEGLNGPQVAKLAMVLRRAGYIQSSRGQAGGYALARAPEEISVSALLADLGGRLYDETFCVRHSGHLSVCRHSSECTVRSLWEDVQSAVDRVLAPLTLRDLLARRSGASNVSFGLSRPTSTLK